MKASPMFASPERRSSPLRRSLPLRSTSALDLAFFLEPLLLVAFFAMAWLSQNNDANVGAREHAA
jgi:hypothetical protein